MWQQVLRKDGCFHSGFFDKVSRSCAMACWIKRRPDDAGEFRVRIEQHQGGGMVHGVGIALRHFHVNQAQGPCEFSQLRFIAR